MEPMELEEETARTVQNLTLVWGSMIASLLVFAGLTYYLLSSGDVRPVAGASESLLGLVMVTLGFALLIAAPFLARTLARKAEQEEASGTKAYQTAMIAGYALREAAGLIGVMTVLVTGALIAGYALAAAALVMLLKARPRAEHLSPPPAPTP